jgi:hypothetical protein
MKFLLIAYFLSSGQYTQQFATLNDCNDVIIEAQLTKGTDLWSAVCVDPENEILISAGADLGP